MIDGWVVYDKSGRSWHEKDLRDKGVSPWSFLIRNSVGVVGMSLCLGGRVVGLPANALGYWHARAFVSSPGLEPKENIGVGYVDGNGLHCLWGTYDGAGNPFFWSEDRDARTQNQIIWRA